jgi:hypothetical protein
MTRPRPRTIALTATGVFLLCQLITIRHDNPPAAGLVDAPPAVVSILRRSCYDCHSNETAWRWYTYVAPVSWLAGYDVHDGRRRLNFSEWSRDQPPARKKQMNDLVRDVEGGEMPPWYYTPAHPAARLGPVDAATVSAWARAQTPP